MHSTSRLLNKIILLLTIFFITFVKSYAIQSEMIGKVAYFKFVDGKSKLFTMNLDGTGQEEIITGHSNHDSYPDLSSDGTKIAFVNSDNIFPMGASRICVYNFVTSELDTLFDQHYFAVKPAWSPNDSMIAFDAAPSGLSSQRVWVMLSDGSNPHPIIETNLVMGIGDWSFDGGKIAFSTNNNISTGEIYYYDFVQNTVEQLTFDGTGDSPFVPCWSPDGMNIVFASRLNGQIYLRIINVDDLSSSYLETIAPHPISWGADNKIYFGQDGANGADLFSINPDGTNKFNITNSEGVTEYAPQTQFTYNQFPIAQCQNITTSLGYNCSIDVDINNGSYDPDNDIITINQIPEGPYNLGVTNVTLVVTDEQGAQTYCEATITIVDITPPEITVPENIVLECVGSIGREVTFEVTAIDNCNTDINVSCTPQSGSIFPIGTTEVICSAEDSSGNVSTNSFYISIIDTIPPIIACLNDTIVECSSPDGAILYYNIDVFDNCDDNTTVTYSHLSGSLFPIGMTQVNCVATDAEGNSSSCNFSITVTEGKSDLGGNISNVCSDLNNYLLSVPIDIYDDSGFLILSSVTNENGYYYIDDIQSGKDYNVSIVPPLGFYADYNEQLVSIECGAIAQIDFHLQCSDIESQPRTIGFWKHQVGVALGGNGKAQVSSSELCSYLDQINGHFNSNLLNEVVVYEPAESGMCEDNLLVAKEILNLKGKVDMYYRAKQQLMAVLFNVSANFISLTEIISEDGATLSQAITFCDNVLDVEGSNYELAKTICDDINNGKEIQAGIIPLDIENIAYKQGEENLIPTEFSLSQNYPNPFNPTTSISFSLPEGTDVKLEVYNIQGQKVTTLTNQHFEAGNHSVNWDAGSVASGVYLYKLDAGSFTESKKMLLLK